MWKTPWTYLIVSLFLAACGTKPVSNTEPVMNAPTSVAQEEADGTNVDYPALQRSLGLERSFQDLGYSEKAFDTCKVGYGYSGTKHCRREIFVVLHFQLVCRDSEGTVSQGVDKVDMRALADRSVKWNLKGISGTVKTDGEGFGQIQTTSPFSQRTQRVKLAVGPEFLYMRANEITKVVTPKPWCNQ
jgi:hypothetical protein